MLYKVIIISLIEVAIHVCTLDGMIFGKQAQRIDDFLDIHGMQVLSKPLHACLMCMGGLWTVILYTFIFGFDIGIIEAIPLTIGLNSILSYFIKHLEQ